MVDSSFFKDDKASVGIETAIILITFTIIASVLSYAILSAGYFAAGTSENVGTAVVGKASSALIVTGSLLGYERDGGIGDLRVVLTSAPAGDPVAMSGLSLRWSTDNTLLNIPQNSPLYADPVDVGSWGITGIRPSGHEGDVLLEDGEVFVLSIRLPEGDELSADERFSLEFIGTGSAILKITGQAPSGIDPVNILR